MRGWIVGFVVCLLSWVAWVRTENFSPNAVRGPKWESHLCSGEVRERLSMPYRYLSSGRQAYVFVSEDGKSVLKLFKKSYYSMPWYLPLLPWKEREVAKRQKRRCFYQQSYEIAERELKEETGLLFVGCGTDLPLIHLVDKAHRYYDIDLNQTSFVLQKRGEPLEKGDCLVAAELFLQEVARRIAKGIADGDRDVEHNFGWFEGNLLHLDPGRFFYDAALQEPKRRREEWQSAMLGFRKWLRRQAPELIPFFDAKAEKLPLHLSSEETRSKTG